MKNRSVLYYLAVGLATGSGFALQNCKPTQSVTASAPVEQPSALEGPTPNSISYGKDIRPLMLKSCTPCHFPEQGQKKMLNTYDTTKDNIRDIITRVMLPSEDEKSMPYKGKRPRLTADELKLLTDWIGQGMPR